MAKIKNWNFLIDGLSLFALGISILLLKNYLEPKERGFFCNDTSLRYPYHDSSITTLVNNIICYGAPILIIIVKNLCDVQIKSRQPRGACQNCIREISLFLFAVFTVQMLNNVIKFSAGRLRPHFFKVCKPDIDFTDETICGTFAEPNYVTNFTCTGNRMLFHDKDEMNARIREARLSFLSGHASLSWYGMTWAAGYLYMLASGLPKFTLPIGVAQVLALVYALIVACSRVTDNKHHPGDVMAGAAMGTLLALLSLAWVKDHQRSTAIQDIQDENNESVRQSSVELIENKKP